MRALAFAAFFILACCNREPPHPDITGPEVDAVHAVIEDINTAVEARDSARAARHYWAGSLIADTDTDLIVGPRVLAYYQSLAADEGSRLAFGQSGVSVSAARDMAYSWGEYNALRHDPQTHGAMYVTGNFLIVLERREGAWIIIHETHTPLIRASGADSR